MPFMIFELLAIIVLYLFVSSKAVGFSVPPNAVKYGYKIKTHCNSKKDLKRYWRINTEYKMEIMVWKFNPSVN